MRYQSKKDENIFANFVNKLSDGGVMLVYETGPNAGNPLTISDSTLKRWWTPVNSETTQESVDDFLSSIDNEQINEPYSPEVEPRVIEKPEAVVDYENIKKRKNKYEELPQFSEICEKLVTSTKLVTKVNEGSSYIKFTDGTTLWKKVRAVNVYATEAFAESLVSAGLESTKNNDKNRPFAFMVNTVKNYEALIKAICEMEDK